VCVCAVCGSGCVGDSAGKARWATLWEYKTEMEGVPCDGILPLFSHLNQCCSVPPSAPLLLSRNINYVLCVDIIGNLSSHISLRSSLCVGASMMDPKVSPTQLPVASSSHQQHSSEHSTAATHPQFIDLKALHSSFGHTSPTLEKRGQPQQVRMPLARSPNLSESDRELVLALGLEEVGAQVHGREPQVPH
jgi:hypothetical protein